MKVAITFEKKQIIQTPEEMSELIKRIVDNANNEQMSLYEVIDLIIKQYDLTPEDINDIWSIIYINVKDIFNPYCYDYHLKQNFNESIKQLFKLKGGIR